MSPKLVQLVDRQDLNDECISLLNEEWPRSYTSRAHSQKKSCRSTPPLSLLLIDDEILIGHSRLCLLPDRSDACWIESVIIKKSHRGKGLGKTLMNLSEVKARSFGFTKIYLSTHDQVAFYRSCGYTICLPILHSTTSTSVFPVVAKLTTVTPPTVPKPTVPKSIPESGSTVTPPTVPKPTVPRSIPESGSTVPAPPPPPPLIRSKKAVHPGDSIDYMCKDL